MTTLAALEALARADKASEHSIQHGNLFLCFDGDGPAEYYRHAVGSPEYAPISREDAESLAAVIVKGYMASFKGRTSSVYPTHGDAAAAFGATLRNGSKFSTYAVKQGPGELWLTDYHADLPKPWIVKQGTAVALN